MKLNYEVIPAENLESGDMFYCTPDLDLNDFGIYFELTGTDQIFIMDDIFEYDDADNYSILVNGGWTIWFRPEEKVVRLGHYSDLVRVIEMVKEGNPSMELGPNDSITKVDALIEQDPSRQINLLDNLFDENNREEGDDDDEVLFKDDKSRYLNQKMNSFYALYNLLLLGKK